MKKIYYLFLIIFFISCTKENKIITPPKLTNNPSWDVICTNSKPLLSFFVSKGGIGKRKYIIQLDTDPNFNSKNFIEYQNVEELDKFLVEKKIDVDLIDNSRYFWRAKAIDSLNNQSDWANSRFYVSTQDNKHFFNLTRVPIKHVEASTGVNVKNLIDYDDPGQVSFWSAKPPGPIKDFLKFNFGKNVIISRIWMLSNFDNDNGWLVDFVWQKSFDGKNWEDIPDVTIKNNDTFRNIIDIKPIKTHFLRLKITNFIGPSPQLNCVIFYSPQMPKIPLVPSGKYILIIGNQMNGGTYTQLCEYIESLNLGIKTFTIPYYEASLKMLNKLKNKPIAIILSGNNADYPSLPMFEYNGVFEIIKNSDLPILGICAGHQMLAFAYGYSYVRSMGWQDITSLEKNKYIKPIYITKNDLIFDGMKNPFSAPEVHGWAIGFLPEEFEILAKSTYIQCIKHKNKFIYGCQFHPEIEVSNNEGKNFLINFVKMSLEKANKFNNKSIKPSSSDLPEQPYLRDM